MWCDVENALLIRCFPSQRGCMIDAPTIVTDGKRNAANGEQYQPTTLPFSPHGAWRTPPMQNAMMLGTRWQYNAYPM
eukprot:5199154-Lingulodinium_polyedra.AAC.1